MEIPSRCSCPEIHPHHSWFGPPTSGQPPLEESSELKAANRARALLLKARPCARSALQCERKPWSCNKHALLMVLRRLRIDHVQPELADPEGSTPSLQRPALVQPSQKPTELSPHLDSPSPARKGASLPHISSSADWLWWSRVRVAITQRVLSERRGDSE